MRGCTTAPFRSERDTPRPCLKTQYPGGGTAVLVNPYCYLYETVLDDFNPMRTSVTSVVAAALLVTLST